MRSRRLLLATLLIGALLIACALWPWVYDNFLDTRVTIIDSSDQLAGTWRVTGNDYSLPGDVAKRIDRITFVPHRVADGVLRDHDSGLSETEPATRGILIAGP